MPVIEVFNWRDGVLCKAKTMPLMTESKWNDRIWFAISLGLLHVIGREEGLILS